MATSQTERQLLTVEDVLAMPDDGDRLELIRGELLRMPPVGFEHSDIVLGLGGELRRHVLANGLGRVGGGDPGFILQRDPYTFLGPDIAFIRADRVPEDRHGILELAPDLVVEIISPSDRFNDVTEKVATYLECGVRCVWLVQPLRKRVFVYIPDTSVQELLEGDTLDGGDIVPGFAIPVAEIFR
jgi:Uma2 family endonuclease